MFLCLAYMTIKITTLISPTILQCNLIKLQKNDSGGYFMYNSLDIGIHIKITDDKIKYSTDCALCLKCNLNPSWPTIEYKSSNKYCCVDHYIITNPYTLTFGNHTSYVLSGFRVKCRETYEYMTTKFNKNICYDELIKKKIIIFSPCDELKIKIKSPYNEFYLPLKYFTGLTINPTKKQNKFIYYDKIYNSKYFTLINLKGKYVGFQTPCEKTQFNEILIRKKFTINIGLFPLGIIYAHITNITKSYIGNFFTNDIIG